MTSVLRCFFSVQLMIVFVFPALVLATPQAMIVSSNDHELVLTLDVPTPTVEQTSSADSGADSGQSLQRIVVPGWARTSTPGLPDLPVQSVLLQVPASGHIALEVLPENIQSLALPELAAAPRLVLDDNGKEQTLQDTNNQAAKLSGPFPATWAELGQREWIRSVPVVRLTLHPFRWDSLSKTLSQAGRLRVVIRFEESLCRPSATGVMADSFFQPMFQQSLVNYTPCSTPNREQNPPTIQATGPSGNIRIEVNTDGLVSVDGRDLLSAGLTLRDLLLMARDTLRLTCQGREIPIQLSHEQRNRALLGNPIRFYGQALDTPYTDTNVYWLSWGETPGLRMGVREGAITGQGTPVTQYWERQHIEKNITTWAMTPGAPDVDYWFWEKLTAPVSRQYIAPLTAIPSGSAQGVLRIAFQGRSTDKITPDHHVKIRVNGGVVGEISWDGATPNTAELAIPANVLINGDNVVQIDLPSDSGTTVDVVYLNWIEIDYIRPLQAISDRLDFTLAGSGRQQITVNGFIDQTIRVYDITQADAPVEIIHSVIQPSDGGYQVQFETDVQGTCRFLALTESGDTPPIAVQTWKPTGLKNVSTGADWIGITDKSFLSALEPLRQHRSAQGLRAITVSVQDIMNEFNQGIFDPAAIQTFLKYTLENWPAPAPLFILMAGDANFDYRNYMKTGKANLAPVYLSWTDEIGLTPDDNFYVCVAGEDRLPDMAIGRIPGSNAEAITAQVQKILNHEASASVSGGVSAVMLVADNNDPQYESINETMAAFIPAGIPIERVYLSKYGSTDAATQDIIAGINHGVSLVNYVGHGAVTNWAGEYLFENSDVALLSNTLYPFGIQMTCLNGFFAHWDYYCLAEEMIRFGDRGAIGSFASSGLNYTWEHELLEHFIFDAAFNKGEYRLGVLSTVAKLVAYSQGASQDMVTTFTLLGDPASRVR